MQIDRYIPIWQKQRSRQKDLTQSEQHRKGLYSTIYSNWGVQIFVVHAYNYVL